MNRLLSSLEPVGSRVFVVVQTPAKHCEGAADKEQNISILSMPHLMIAGRKTLYVFIWNTFVPAKQAKL